MAQLPGNLLQREPRYPAHLLARAHRRHRLAAAHRHGRLLLGHPVEARPLRGAGVAPRAPNLRVLQDARRQDAVRGRANVRRAARSVHSHGIRTAQSAAAPGRHQSGGRQLLGAVVHIALSNLFACGRQSADLRPDQRQLSAGVQPDTVVVALLQHQGGRNSGNEAGAGNAGGRWPYWCSSRTQGT